jgi:hypothetical protein
MKAEDKDLLLRDLCARLPYGIIVKTPQGDGHLNEVSLTIFSHELGVNIKATERTYFKLEECKPYLRPMSSMTEEEKTFYEYHKEGHCSSGWATTLVDWLNKNMFDYRGLIEKGLALPAPESM